MLTVSGFSPGLQLEATDNSRWEIIDLHSCNKEDCPFQVGDIVCWGPRDQFGQHAFPDLTKLSAKILIGPPGGIVLQGYADDSLGQLLKSLSCYLPPTFAITGLRKISSGDGKRVYVPSIFSEQVPLP